MLIKPANLCGGCPLYEKPYGSHMGHVPATGSGDNGVLIVLEAAGNDERKEGVPLVGKSGYTLFQQLKRVDIEREGFKIHNVLSCQPPDNKLLKMPYELGAVAHCAPQLDATIEEMRSHCRQLGKTFVIIAMGVPSFKRVMGFDYKKDADLLKKDYWGYPFWADRYGAWVFAAPHPAFLLRGNTHLWPVVWSVFKRALEVAEDGLRLDEPDYLLDPDASGFDLWIDGYLKSLLANPDNPLSYDIETPYKKKVKDEDEVGKEEAALDDDHTILRCSFAYVDKDGTTHTTSVVWDARYMAGIERLFLIAPFVLGWNSDKYDYPRVSRYIKVNGISLDGMIAWHILNSSMKKSLGFVTPYYWKTTLMWKHLGEKEPAFYNAKDADAALRNWIGIKADLIEHKLWPVYERHWIELSKALKYMSGIGVLRDNEMRDKAEVDMSTLLDGIESRMDEAVPEAARQVKIYKKLPKKVPEGIFGLLKSYPIKYCGVCGEQKPTKRHSNVCLGTTDVYIDEPQKVYGVYLDFKISKKRMTSYQSILKHQAILSRKERKVTFNADALTMLMKKYPNDRLYPLILDHRKINKLLGTYVGTTNANGRLTGGMQIGSDNRIHTVYGRDASTLRFTSEDPNLQNLPRPNAKDITDLCNIIRNLVVAQPGWEFGATDFAGIEAVLVGWFALYPEYIRLALRDVHTYLTVYGIYETEGSRRIQASDLPDLSWPDDRLFPYLKQLKKEFSEERNKLYKHIGHAFNFGQSPQGTQAKVYSETGVEYPLKTFQHLQDIYFTLFPKIKQWQRNVTNQAEKDGYLRNPFGYVSRFSKVFDYKKERGEWIKNAGPDWNKVIAYGPQSTAVGIITESILELFHNKFEEAGQYLRLQVHDELLYETPKEKLDNVIEIVENTMHRPIPQLRLPTSWGLGEYLQINTESKRGIRWGSMK